MGNCKGGISALQNSIVLDVSEDDINKIDKSLLAILLKDRTTRRNIIWGTDNYSDLGDEYTADNEIKQELITGNNSKVIQPRIAKELHLKRDRTRHRAEVFTPSWVCNAQNNMVDEQWFDGKLVFNIPKEGYWETITQPIPFEDKGKKTWEKYVDAKRLEITCGEAPYLASRYDTVTGETIPVNERIGLLDRKLRVVRENTESNLEWKKWARRAVESVYGYEFQGDSLLLARENLFYTYIEHYRERFNEEPDNTDLYGIAHVISWNLWQMDGFNYAIPYCKVEFGPRQISLFDFNLDDDTLDSISYRDTKGQQLCKIRDWRSKETLLYRSMVEEVQK